MPLFCDVALAVPLDMLFTYAIPPGMEPVVGGRVLVPFRQQRQSGIVVELHDRPPQVKTKKVIEALDLVPVLDERLLKLGKWIADYYLAPLGEVFRTMLPLSAEFKRSIVYRITDQGRMALHLAGMSGSPTQSKRTPDEQLVEFRVLDYLAERGSVSDASLRGAARGSKALLSGMVRKKWIAREDVSAARDATRRLKVAVLMWDGRPFLCAGRARSRSPTGPWRTLPRNLTRTSAPWSKHLRLRAGACRWRPCVGWMSRAQRSAH